MICSLAVVAFLVAVVALGVVIRIDRRHARETRERQALRDAIRSSFWRNN